jgi:hypothetical protein
LFDLEVYREILSHFQHDFDPESAEAIARYPQPTKPIGRCTFDQYKAVFRKLYKYQKAIGVQSHHWDEIWQMGLEELGKHVKTRQPMIKKLTFQEKIDGEFAPYTIVEHYPSIEEELWKDSNDFSRRSVLSKLRDRYCCEHLTSGILRCESLTKAEWSDYLGITVPKQMTDVDDMYVMINQIDFGKTNHGRTLYGRAIRHKDVKLCPIGALSFYAQFRFDCTGEFAHFTVHDWINRELWFNVKVLIDLNQPDKQKEMTSKRRWRTDVVD